MNQASQRAGGETEEDQKQVEIVKQSCTNYKKACSQTSRYKLTPDVSRTDHGAQEDKEVKKDTLIVHNLDYNKEPEIHCNVCGRTDEKPDSFKCKDCELSIHRGCKDLSATTPCNHHDHILSLFILSDEYRNFKLCCDVCHKQFRDVHWVYNCRPCRFFVHVLCAVEKTMIAEDDIEPYSMFNMVQLPVANAAPKLATRFLKQNGLLTINPTRELVSSFHEHPLDLLSNENITDELVCDGCIEPILFGCQYYSCKQCSYFLHDTCSQLPSKLELRQHPSHEEHPIQITHPDYFFGVAECSQCKSQTNGWFFKCSSDEVILDMKCTFLPTDIAHKAHMHPLARISAGPDRGCSACGKTLLGSSSYRCTSSMNCEFYIGIECALLPPKITHKWDEHPLILKYPPFPENPDDFLCEICEKNVHPKHWVYHCNKCDQSFHPRCISRLSENRNIKFGGSIEIAAHSLKLVEEGKYKSECGGCKDHLNKKNALQCTKCDLHICRKCALEKLENKKKEGATTISPCNCTVVYT